MASLISEYNFTIFLQTFYRPAMDKPKITEIYEDRILTRNIRNEYGQWETVQKEMRYKKPINDLSIGLRLVNFIIDTAFYYQIVPILLDAVFSTPTEENQFYGKVTSCKLATNAIKLTLPSLR